MVFDDLGDDGILLGYQAFHLAEAAEEVSQLRPATALERQVRFVKELLLPAVKDCRVDVELVARVDF